MKLKDIKVSAIDLVLAILKASKNTDLVGTTQDYQDGFTDAIDEMIDIFSKETK